MNAVTGLVAIVSLLLALAAAGGAAKEQAGVSPKAERQITTSKLGVNHNETLARDTTSSNVPRPAGCPTWMCGSNHNDTLVSDATSVQQEDTLSQWLTNVQAYVFASFTSYAPVRGGCDDWGCGMNHNETLVRDAAGERRH